MNLRTTPLVQLTRQARRPSRWWLAWLVVMVIIVAVPPLGIAVGDAVLGAPASTNPWYPYVDAFGALATLLALFAWVRLKEGRPFTTVGFRPGREWVRLLVGLGVGAGLMSVVVVLGLVAGVYGNGRSTHSVAGADALLPLLPLALLFLVQAIAQASLTAGYLLQMSLRQLPGWLAIIATSILVAVLHSLNPLSMLNLFLLAVFGALVVLQQGSLWLVAGVQGGWSCVQASVFGLPVGGIAAPTAVFSIGPVPGTANLVTGGRFGVETGLLATPVLLVAIVVAYVALRRTTRIATGTSPVAEPPTPAPRKEHTHVHHEG